MDGWRRRIATHRVLAELPVCFRSKMPFFLLSLPTRVRKSPWLPAIQSYFGFGGSFYNCDRSWLHICWFALVDQIELLFVTLRGEYRTMASKSRRPQVELEYTLVSAKASCSPYFHVQCLKTIEVKISSVFVLDEWTMCVIWSNFFAEMWSLHFVAAAFRRNSPFATSQSLLLVVAAAHFSASEIWKSCADVTYSNMEFSCHRPLRWLGQRGSNPNFRITRAHF
jgi:hypothetical protein